MIISLRLFVQFRPHVRIGKREFEQLGVGRRRKSKLCILQGHNGILPCRSIRPSHPRDPRQKIERLYILDLHPVKALEVLLDVKLVEDAGNTKDYLIRTTGLARTHQGKDEIGKVELWAFRNEFQWHDQTLLH